MPEPMITIVFRGLLVLSVREVEGSVVGEVGILHTAPGHFLRINTVKNCVLESVMSIKEEDIQKLQRDWKIVIEDPVGDPLKIEKPGDFNRKEPNFTTDFRWIIDLEGDEFYKMDLTEHLNTTILKPVINIPSGLLYSRLKSRELDRIKGNEEAENFGFISAAIGCDIKIKETSRVTLNAGEEELFVFDFNEKDPHTIYEIVNAPPDVQSALPAPHEHDQNIPKPDTFAGYKHYHLMLGDDNVTKFRFEVERETNASDCSAKSPASGSDMSDKHSGTKMPQKKLTAFDHFIHYYLMFKDPNVVKFRFEEAGGDPGPRPALCGVVRLGSRTVPL